MSSENHKLGRSVDISRARLPRRSHRMAPIENTTEFANNTVKLTSGTGADESFESPSLQKKPSTRKTVNRNSDLSNSGCCSDYSQSDNGSSLTVGCTYLKPKAGCKRTDSKSILDEIVYFKSTDPVSDLDPIKRKAETLAEFIVLTLVGRKDGKTTDEVEQTMLRCVDRLMRNHEISFRGTMKRLQITRETGYITFVGVANEIFEGQKAVVNWGRVIALYAFGGQLASYCKAEGMEDFVQQIAVFTGRYAAEFITPFVVEAGGWNKLCEEFPQEGDSENKVWKFLTWTAVGLGVAATASFLTSHYE